MNKKANSVGEMLRNVRAAKAAGDYERAYLLGERLLSTYPLNADAMNEHSESCLRTGKAIRALEWICQRRQSGVRLAAGNREFYVVLEQLLSIKHFPEMEQAARWLIERFPKDDQLLNYLGIALLETSQFTEAREVLEQAVQRLPDNPSVLSNYGYALVSLEKSEAAVPYLRKAIELSPTLFVAYNNLGNALRWMGRYDEAISVYLAAIRIAPEQPYVYNNLGLAYTATRAYDQAIASYQKVLELQPDLSQVYPNYIDALRQARRNKEAISLAMEVMERCAAIPEYWAAFGDVLRESAHVDQAIEAYIKALSFNRSDIQSFNRKVYSNLLFCMNYHADLSADLIYQTYKEFDQRFGEPGKRYWRSFTQQKDPGRRLRIGYVTPSFYNQVCKYFLIPLLDWHDHTQFELFAYANPPCEDETTAYYKTRFEHWVDIRAMTDDQLEQRIRDDQIDILIDVAGHTNENKLAVFARKPAPVSAHWLEYGYTTGLSAIDYYITDQACAAGEGTQQVFSENLWVLDGPAYVYRPDTRTADLTPLPALSNGFITFGSLSRSIRINHKVVKVWAAILDAIPNSRLVINSGDFEDAGVQEEMASRFMQYGIERERLLIGFSTPSWSVLKQIDIGLDCFPHNSGTTLLESLYMGIPFISMFDRPSVGRIGSSVLVAANHPEWIATTEMEYAQKAVMLAHDVERLVYLREHLREELQASPAMNEPAFARSMEKAYRQMWQLYCAKEET